MNGYYVRMDDPLTPTDLVEFKEKLGRAGGAPLEAFVELHCPGAITPDSVLDIVRPHHQVIDAYTVSGMADALVHLRCTDVPELERTLEQMRTDERVARTSTIIVLSRLITRTR
jgi:DNA-binding Lrp family transcriptional regulator